MDIENPRKKRRRRVRQELPLRDRLMRAAEQARASARELPAGPERVQLLKKARELEAVVNLDEFLAIPLEAPHRIPHATGRRA
jgi:hypothetical protein